MLKSVETGGVSRNVYNISLYLIKRHLGTRVLYHRTRQSRNSNIFSLLKRLCRSLTSAVILARSVITPVVSAWWRTTSWVAVVLDCLSVFAKSLLVPRLVILGQLDLELAAHQSVHPPLARLELLLLRLVLLFIVLEVLFCLDSFLDLDKALDGPRRSLGLYELDPAVALALSGVLERGNLDPFDLATLFKVSGQVLVGCLEAHVAHKDLATGIGILLLLCSGLAVGSIGSSFSLLLGPALERCRILDEEFSATEVILSKSLLDASNHLVGDDTSRVIHEPLAHLNRRDVERQVTNPDAVLRSGLLVLGIFLLLVVAVLLRRQCLALLERTLCALGWGLGGVYVDFDFLKFDLALGRGRGFRLCHVDIVCFCGFGFGLFDLNDRLRLLSLRFRSGRLGLLLLLLFCRHFVLCYWIVL
ncbi:hypothetical protein HG531_007866 [Fusarium graminearum]|nr:hypothetical protein HG531_007866 [Fusarium graminearum]